MTSTSGRVKQLWARYVKKCLGKLGLACRVPASSGGAEAGAGPGAQGAQVGRSEDSSRCCGPHREEERASSALSGVRGQGGKGKSHPRYHYGAHPCTQSTHTHSAAGCQLFCLGFRVTSAAQGRKKRGGRGGDGTANRAGHEKERRKKRPRLFVHQLTPWPVLPWPVSPSRKHRRFQSSS